MSRPHDLPKIGIAEVAAKLPLAVWQALYAAAARTDHLPVVRIRDAGRQFVLIEAEDFEKLQRYWTDYEPPERPLRNLIYGERSAQCLTFCGSTHRTPTPSPS